ncbi:hypothetical protein [Allocoleopsis franciscana]|uniref:Uncharacterized protein n=1 Tax=Allocoleopsis franciscana PCC 7113 TaxID=1173027 RepID=K9WG17_9CYAN|nr:hypothetical protein [Allocoleopsis franciscana]AFZ18736.1 hypothetical protein Mic7113_2963 [Allocoleopsis franciscana PCC 7113]
MDATTIILDLPPAITNDYLQNQANVDTLSDQYQKTYQYIRRSAKPIGFLVHEKLVLKLYHMLREAEPLPQHLQDNLQSFILDEINHGRVDAKQGVGFAILSQGFLSINIWGRGNVLFTQTYTVEGSFPELSPKPLEKTGVACTWEIKVMNHEYALWHHYLETKMSIADKRAYLQSFIRGNLF